MNVVVAGVEDPAGSWTASVYRQGASDDEDGLVVVIPGLPGEAALELIAEAFGGNSYVESVTRVQ